MAVVALRTSGPLAPADPTPAPEYRALTQRQRRSAEKRLQLVQAVKAVAGQHLSTTAAIDELLAAVRGDQASPTVTRLAFELGRGRQPVSRATLYRWCKAYADSGLPGLASNHTGRVRKNRDWEVRALHLYQLPSQPALATVADWLREEGFDAPYHQVRRYLQSLPSNRTDTAPQRVGRHYHRQNLTPHVVRDAAVLPVGFIYEGDGHTCDVYVAHPMTGNPWRPELTVWLDVRSRAVVGWYLSEAESAHSTLLALSHALTAHDHVPAAIHVDPGSGFKNRLIQGEATAFCARLSIEFMASLPGNARGKGLVERWFGIFEERLGKRFATYCGHNRTDDLLSRLSTKVRRGEIELPTLTQYRDAIAEWVDTYNRTPQRGTKRAPLELWGELQRTPLELPESAVVRPQEQRVVQRQRVSLHNRLYQAAELAAYERREVAVEYDLHDDREVTVRTLDGRFIVTARQVDAKPWLPESRIDELRQQRLKGQIRRRELANEEDRLRAGTAITHADQLETIDQFTERLDSAAPAALPDPAGTDTALPAIDLLRPILDGTAADRAAIHLDPLDPQED